MERKKGTRGDLKPREDRPSQNKGASPPKRDVHFPSQVALLDGSFDAESLARLFGGGVYDAGGAGASDYGPRAGACAPFSTTPPVVVAGQGGSGSRGLALLLRAAGVAMNGDRDTNRESGAVSRKPLQFRFNMTLYESMRTSFVSRSRELVQR